MRGPGAIVRLRIAVAVSAGEVESVTLKVNDTALVIALGVPLMSPLEGLSERPSGRLPETNCQLYGPVPPEAVSVLE